MRRAVSGSLLSDLSGLVAARMGLNYPQERWGDLERGVAAAARELGFGDVESCARWLCSGAAARGHIEILASHLTVGETYFFRGSGGFDALEKHILPELFRLRRDGERRIRIWSAGCCTGEEPYSIAMLLDRLIPDPNGWHVTVLATDINPRFLRKAAQAVYGEWSFRGTPEWVRERYFRKRKDGRFALVPHIRDKVTFSYLNLADDVYPSLRNNTNAMDVIFCRNVLMYFHADRAKAVSRNLYRSLVDGGWLVVSATETSNILFSSFSAVEFPGALLYRKAASAGPQAFSVADRDPAFPEDSWAAHRPEPGFPDEIAVPESARPVPRSPNPQPPGRPDALERVGGLARAPENLGTAAARARNCADQGRLAEAAEWCERAIATDKLNAAHHYLLAAVQQENGQIEAALQSLQRAVYLDAGFALAHFALGNMELSRGRYREARRHFANALALLRAGSGDDILPESDGLTVARLIEIIASVLSGLPRAAACA